MLRFEPTHSVELTQILFIIKLTLMGDQYDITKK